MKSFAALLAATAVRRPALLIAAALFLLAAAALILRTQQEFDSEILNILPSNSPSVQGLRIYNSQFQSSRELAFLVLTKENADEALTEDFVDELRSQPWVLRVLDAPPTQSALGRATLPDLIAPIVLGQENFSETLTHLTPDAIRTRIAGLAARTSAGSPIARLELENDPLGIITPVAGLLSEKLSIGDAFELDSPGARIIPVVTRPTDLSAPACRELMQQVHGFVSEFQKHAGPDAPEILVTGRAAYVDEISSSMQRDILTTSIVSILAVTVLFWFSFRSLVPLAGSVLILAFTCLLSLAAGSLIFDKLNVVAMGFCSILVGLGDDFSLLLYQRYLGARASGADRETAIRESTVHAAPSILWVALTTSLGFAMLAFSGSAGFGQLGLLIATGVVFGALGMIVFMPLFERGENRPIANDPVLRLCVRILSRPVLLASGAILTLAAVIAILPWRSLSFDTSTHSLEPRDIPAARALAKIMEIFPATFEPVMVLIPGPASPQALLALDATLEELRQSGLVTQVSSPSPLVPDANRVEAASRQVASLDWAAMESAVESAGVSAGLTPDALEPARHLLRALRSTDPLAKRLPEHSPWWFVVERSFSPSSGDVIYYVRLKPGATAAERQSVEARILETAPQALVTGWSQMLSSLVPWATRELVVFGGLVIVIIIAVLLATYRRVGPLLLHLAVLALSLAGTVATLKALDHPVNLLNVLAFPLILAVGVDYGVHLLLAARETGDRRANMSSVMKPVLISGLTTITGFGALLLAKNPALSGLGLVCATGVAWCLFSSLCFLAPLACKVHRGD